MQVRVFILLMLLHGLGAYGKVIRVSPNGAITSIHVALQQAAAFDTVVVAKGIYTEGTITVNKPVVLLGEDKPILDGQKKGEIIVIGCPDVVVSGFHLRKSGTSSLVEYAAIKIIEASRVIVSHNTIEDCFFGIYSQGSSKVSVIKNSIIGTQKLEQESGNGIHCWKSDSLTIVENTISGHRDGIYFEFVTGSVIWRNYSFNNIRYGLHFMFSHHDAYYQNIFESNGAGVAVMYSNHVHMERNWFRYNKGDAAYGLLLKEISDSYIQGNYFNENTIGCLLEGASRIDFKLNYFNDNGWGMRIQASCMEIDVHLNTFKGNTFDVATNGSLVLNDFSNNYWDKYQGFDLNRNSFGDVPYRPVSVFAMIAEQNPPVMLLMHSLIAFLIDKAEKVLPVLTPELLKDEAPLMKPATF